MKQAIFPDGETFLLCAAIEPHLGRNRMRMNYRIRHLLMWWELYRASRLEGCQMNDSMIRRASPPVAEVMVGGPTNTVP